MKNWKSADCRVVLVGAGPGHRDLITVRGAKYLRLADAIVFDHLIDPALLELAKPGAMLIDASKEAGKHKLNQAEINRQLIRHARAGQFVVRLKGGDPFIFGRGGEEAEALAKAKIPFEVVPGVTAASGASALAGVPLSHRDFASSITLVTAHAKAGSVDVSKIPKDGTVAIYMGASTLPQITRALISAGWSAATPAVCVQWAATKRQKVVEGKLSSIAKRAARLKPPVLTIVGKVASLCRSLRWLDSMPLLGKRVVTTCSERLWARLSAPLAACGADATWAPTMAYEPTNAGLPAGNFDWVIFTSSYAVFYFPRHLLDSRPAKFAAVGEVTADGVRLLFRTKCLVPKEQTTRGLIRLLKKRVKPGERVLYPCGPLRNPEVKRALKRLGADVKEIEVYRPRKLEIPDRIKRADFVVVTSSQQFRDLKARKDLLRRARVVCIGPATAKTARRLGFRPAAVAKHPSPEGIIDALLHS